MPQLIDSYDPEADDIPSRFLGFGRGDWHYISKDDSDSVTLGPVPPREDGDDWTLTFTSHFEKGDSEHPFVGVQMPPAVLGELYTELKSIPAEVPQTADQAKCAHCGELVPYDRAVPDERHRPVHRRCYVDEYDAAGWLK